MVSLLKYAIEWDIDDTEFNTNTNVTKSKRVAAIQVDDIHGRDTKTAKQVFCTGTMVVTPAAARPTHASIRTARRPAMILLRFQT